MTGESAIIAAAVSSAFSVATLIITRINAIVKEGRRDVKDVDAVVLTSQS